MEQMQSHFTHERQALSRLTVQLVGVFAEDNSELTDQGISYSPVPRT